MVTKMSMPFIYNNNLEIKSQNKLRIIVLDEISSNIVDKHKNEILFERNIIIF